MIPKRGDAEAIVPVEQFRPFNRTRPLSGTRESAKERSAISATLLLLREDYVILAHYYKGMVSL